jgi:P27 family predicted phage terminase small subunit
MQVKIPSYLSKQSGEIFERISNAWDLNESHVILLTTALEAYDRYLQAKRHVDKNGIVVKDQKTGRLVKNPAVEVERIARTGFLRAWRLLRLDEDIPGEIGRPGG